ncbi:MAG: UDP-3-O-(3-hydroxymyristoyl)glucosamine N-acyltransferase [Clostridium sp.]|nr:UDP-3-O-(3-hydroxymyristoyl)glucosamine N-acyltransferase [Prevotella sp.]MCM1428704.1 UDP-3-O-(3-hydroxymyristoyl)glucosamine N-acyltransferase [Clostridium sp.]MCM1475079.1 UDP-3-O-(3-hydroxymyristoyl)glucosamine N-acyltransferase [Muribaculaceae bacterium]
MKLTPNVLAQFVKGSVDGDGEVEISGFAKIEDAKAGDVTFIANPKYARFAAETSASAILVHCDFVAPDNISTTLIRVADPYSALAELLMAFAPKSSLPVGIEQPAFVDQTVELPEDAYVGAFSYVGKNVTIGKGVKIYPQVFIGNDCIIGDNTIIRPGVKIYEGCVIGCDCIVHSGVVIGADGFGFAPSKDGYEKIPQIGNVVIEDNVEIGSNTTIDRATFGSTVIGKGTKLDNLIQVAHNVVIGNNNVFAAQSGIAGSTHVGDWNRVGGQCGFAGHIQVGSFNEIGAQSGIPNNVGDKRRIIGYPAIDARQFAKNQVYIKKLGEIISTINKK